MFHSRKLNSRINQLHERPLRLVFKHRKATYDELLQKDNSGRVHHRNLQFLATEIFKVKNDLAVTNLPSHFHLIHFIYQGPSHLFPSQSFYRS